MNSFQGLNLFKSAKNGIDAANRAEAAADLAVEVSRIPYETLNLNLNYQFTLAANKCYLLDDDPYIQEVIELTLPTFETAPTYLQQIEMQIVTGSTAPTISWGTAHFFRGKVPTIAASTHYSVIWEYDLNLGAWVCSVISKS